MRKIVGFVLFVSVAVAVGIWWQSSLYWWTFGLAAVFFAPIFFFTLLLPSKQGENDESDEEVEGKKGSKKRSKTGKFLGFFGSLWSNVGKICVAVWTVGIILGIVIMVSSAYKTLISSGGAQQNQHTQNSAYPQAPTIPSHAPVLADVSPRALNQNGGEIKITIYRGREVEMPQTSDPKKKEWVILTENTTDMLVLRYEGEGGANLSDASVQGIHDWETKIPSDGVKKRLISLSPYGNREVSSITLTERDKQ